jgi:phosphoribosylaminoimidazolecarboxamide formyltransferase / IMP cyclohydrolase
MALYTGENALISVSNKQGLEPLAEGLSELGMNIYASGGTAKAIDAAGVPVTDVSEIVGGSAILGHRVVTLSREISAGILANNTPEDIAELAGLHIPRIHLVCVDMYPLHETIKKENITEVDVTEGTDVGGPTMLHAAAKGRRIVLSKGEQRAPILDWLKAGKPNEEAVLRHLAAVAEQEVANYVQASASYLGTLSLNDGKTLGEIISKAS